MEDRLLVGALRSRDPAAIGAVYDTYADRLYQYCWFRLHNRDAAQVALRDTLMCAEAHISELRAPERFGPWLYALARIECRRRRPPGPVQPDITVARHDQDDVDLRLITWRAVTGLPALSQELLDLRHRHALAAVDIAGVVGLPAREVEDLLVQAGVLLEAAVFAEILAHDGTFECEGRAAILRRRHGELDDDVRTALVRHAAECDVCARHLPRKISAAKVYDLLPRVEPPDLLRLQVTGCFTDPEMAGYRLFAAARLLGFGAHGFPRQPGTGREKARAHGSRRWPRAVIALVGAVFTTATAATVFRWFGQTSHGPHASGAGPGSGVRVPSPGLLGPPNDARPVSVTFPLGSHGPGAPPRALDGAPPMALMPAPGAGRLDVTPGRLTLGPGGTGTVTLRAVGGPVRWQATVAGPVRVGPGGGTLGRDQAVAVSVQAPGDGSGNAEIVFWPGGARVAVAWNGPSSSPPPPTPTTPPTGTPPATGTPPTSSPPSTPAPPPTTPASPSPPSSSAPPVPQEHPSAEPPSGPERHSAPASHPSPPASAGSAG